FHFHHTSTFYFNTPASSYIYTLSLHDALPIFLRYQEHPLIFDEFLVAGDVVEVVVVTKDAGVLEFLLRRVVEVDFEDEAVLRRQDRKSTRLNSSHSQISYAVFCLKKKK